MPGGEKLVLIMLILAAIFVMVLFIGAFGIVGVVYGIGACLLGIGFLGMIYGD